MTAWRGVAASMLLVFISLLALPPAEAVYDLVERFYRLELSTRSVPRLNWTEDQVPARVLERVRRAKLHWNSLSGLLQRALIWDAGYISLEPDSSNLAQIYTPCGRTMAEIQIDNSVVINATRPHGCGMDRCGMTNHFLFGGCPTKYLAPVAQCAVVKSEAASAEFASGVPWAEDGNKDNLPVPILRVHSKPDASDNATLYAIHLNTEDFKNVIMCDVQAFFIIPCRAHRDKDENLCEATQGVAIETWLKLASASQSSTFSTTAIIVIALLGAAVLALAIYIVHLTRNRRQLMAEYSPTMGLISIDRFDMRDDADAGEDPTETNQNLTAQSAILRKFVSDPAIITKRIAFSQITILRVLSKGASGEVWLGQFESRYVAMKSLLPLKRKDVRAIEQFSEEIRLASMLEHPRIVQFVGIAWHSLTNLSIVTEYMERGDLEAFLAQSSASNMTWAQEKLALARDIADALVYLHSLVPVVIHRDLKSKNILIDSQLRAKLSDFGLSRETSTEDTMTSGVGTILWSAPEVLEGKQYDEKADIFSYGIVLSEIDTCALPYGFNKDNNRNKMKSMQIVHLVSQGKLLPTFRDDCPPEVIALARQCLDLDPAQRPTAMQVVFTLRSKVFPLLNNGLTCSG